MAPTSDASASSIVRAHRYAVVVIELDASGARIVESGYHNLMRGHCGECHGAPF